MKTMIALTFFLALFQTASAKPRMCPEGSQELISCEAKFVLPLFPYVSVCQNAEAEYAIALDYGSTNLPEVYLAEKIETESRISLKAIDEEADELTIVVDKKTTKKDNGTLSFKSIISTRASKYICKIH